MSVDDFVITHFTRGAGINTLSTLIYSQVKVGVRPTLYALSTLIFVVVLLVLIVFNLMSAGGRAQKDYYASAKKGLSMRTAGAFVLVLLIAVLGLNQYAGSLVGAQNQGRLYIYMFGDYIDPDLIDRFEAETGYELIVDYFDTNERNVSGHQKQYRRIRCGLRIGLHDRQDAQGGLAGGDRFRPCTEQ